MKNIKNIFSITILIALLALTVAGQYTYKSISDQLTKLDQTDEAEVALSIIKNDLPDYFPSEVTAALKKSYPAVPSDKTIRVIPFVRENMIESGEDFDRVKKISDNLLRFMDLRQRIRFIYFKSDIPVTGFTYPFALFISDSAAKILTDDEIEGAIAHEIIHLIVYENFKEAVESNDFKRQRTIELFCDGAAISIIQAKGKNPINVLTGLKKMEKLLQKVDKNAVQGVHHPTIKYREKFYNRLIEKITLAKAQALKK